MVRTANAACAAYRAGVGYAEAHLAHLVVYTSWRPTVGRRLVRVWLWKLEWSETGIDAQRPAPAVEVAEEAP